MNGHALEASPRSLTRTAAIFEYELRDYAPEQVRHLGGGTVTVLELKRTRHTSACQWLERGGTLAACSRSYDMPRSKPRNVTRASVTTSWCEKRCG